MRFGNIRAIQKLLGHKSIKTTEIYAHLNDKHLFHILSLLFSPNMITVLVTPDNLVAPEIKQVVEKKMVGDVKRRIDLRAESAHTFTRLG